MAKGKGRWWGVVIAILVVGALALYAASSGSRPSAPAATVTPAEPVLSGFTGVPSPQAGAQQAPTLSGGDIAALVVKIGVVAGVLGASLWLLRRYAGQRGRVQGRTGAVAIADTIPLAQGRAVYVLDVGDRALIVGATPQQLSLLAEVADEQTLNRLRAAPERPSSPIAALSGSLSLMVQAANAARARQSAARQPLSVLDREAQGMLRRPAGRSFTETLATVHTAEDERSERDQPDTLDEDGRDVLPADRRAALAARLRALGG